MATKRGGIDIPISASWNARGLKQAERQLGSFQKSMTKSFTGLGATIGGALAVGALAAGLRDMATAAAQDEKSVVALSKAMSNMGLAKQTAAMEDFVRATMLATGTSDELIRQGLTRLTSATGDATKSQQLLSLALDVSAAGYGDVVTISTALSKAATGNITTLKRLGVPLDENAVKAKDFGAIIDDLNGTFRGQAAAAANTYAGRLLRVQTAAGEAGETIGYALLKAMDDVSNDMGGTGGIIDRMTSLGDRIAHNVTLMGGFVDALTSMPAPGQTEQSWTDWFPTLPEMVENFGDAVTQLAFDLGMVNKPVDQTGNGFERIGANAQVAAEKMTALPEQLTAVYNTAKNAKGSIDQLKESLDLLNGKDRSAREARINYGDAVRDAKQVGRTVIQGQAVKVKKVNADGSISWSTQKDANGNTVMAPDRVVRKQPKLNSNGGLALGTQSGSQASQALDTIAAAAEELSLARVANGDFSGAQAAITQGQAAVRKQAKSYGLDRFAQYLPQGSPILDQLAAGDSRTRGANALARENGGTTIVIEKVEVTAETPAQVIEQTKQYIRLQSLGAGRGAGQVPTTPRGRR